MPVQKRPSSKSHKPSRRKTSPRKPGKRRTTQNSTSFHSAAIAEIEKMAPRHEELLQLAKRSRVPDFVPEHEERPF